jgi:hypothetical protein
MGRDKIFEGVLLAVEASNVHGSYVGGVLGRGCRSAAEGGGGRCRCISHWKAVFRKDEPGRAIQM